MDPDVPRLGGNAAGAARVLCPCGDRMDRSPSLSSLENPERPTRRDHRWAGCPVPDLQRGGFPRQYPDGCRFETRGRLGGSGCRFSSRHLARGGWMLDPSALGSALVGHPLRFCVRGRAVFGRYDAKSGGVRALPRPDQATTDVVRADRQSRSACTGGGERHFWAAHARNRAFARVGRVVDGHGGVLHRLRSVESPHGDTDPGRQAAWGKQGHQENDNRSPGPPPRVGHGPCSAPRSSFGIGIKALNPMEPGHDRSRPYRQASRARRPAAPGRA